MPHHLRGRYDGFDSPKEVREHYRRSRTLKDFIPSERFVRETDAICPVCRKKCLDRGDAPEGYRSWIGVYSPRFKKFRIMHYVCAWASLLRVVSEMEATS